MAERNYNAPQFNVRDTREVRGGEVARADTRAVAPLQVGDDSWRDGLLRSLGTAASNSLDRMADIEFSNLYLEGQAKAGQIETEDELQGNPITRDWKVAGYRDTMGKLALADAEAQFAVDIVRLREKGPEEMQKYLAERRGKLMPGLSSMSREARASAAGQLLLQDRAAIKTHRDEHTKYIIETKTQAVQTQWTTSLGTLKSAQLQSATGNMSPEAFQETLRNTVGTMFGSVWLDNSLPDSVKQSLTMEMLQRALAEDQVALFDFVAANGLPDGKGGTSPLNARLDGESQLKLSNAYRDAYNRSSDSRNIIRHQQLAQLDAQLDDGTYQGTYEDLQRTLQPMVLNKTISAERFEALNKKFYKSNAARQKNSDVFTAYSRGDILALQQSGMSDREIANTVEAQLTARGMDSGQRLNFWISAGVNGAPGAFAQVGASLGPALRQLRSPDGTVLPQHLRTLETINNAVRAAERNGQGNTRIQLLTGLNEQDRMFAERVFRHVDNNESFDRAVQLAMDTEVKEAALTPSARAGRSTATLTEARKLVQEIEPRGLLETGWLKVKRAFGSQSAAETLAITPSSTVGDRDGWFGDSRVVQQYTWDGQQELENEIGNVLVTSPFASPEEAFSTARSNLAARTIATGNGPLYLPRNVNVQAVFGVAPGNQAAIGRAVDALLPGTVANSRHHVKFVQGRLLAQEYGPDGAPVGTGSFIEPEAIRAKIKEETDKQDEEANAAFGSGRAVRLSNGKVLIQNRAGASRRAMAAAANAPLPGEATPQPAAPAAPAAPTQAPAAPAPEPSAEFSKGDISFNYNGDNIAGVPNTWMLGFRDSLIDHEGVRDKVYGDVRGIQTVGVGIAGHNPHFPKPGPDGRVTAEDIQRSFINASNDAAKAGAAAAKQVGLYTKGGFKLMSELAYQSGVSFLSQKNKVGQRYRDLVQAMKSGDVAAAQEAFKRTAAWRWSGDPKDRNAITRRQENYLRLVKQAMEGQ